MIAAIFWLTLSANVGLFAANFWWMSRLWNWARVLAGLQEGLNKWQSQLTGQAARVYAKAADLNVDLDDEDEENDPEEAEA